MGKTKIIRPITSDQSDLSSLHNESFEDELEYVKGKNIFFYENERGDADIFLDNLKEFIIKHYNEKFPERKIHFRH